MQKETLVYDKTVEIHGEQYLILIYCRSDGRHIAKTSFAEGDVIINDGGSLADVLGKHEDILPLAVNSREVLSQFPGPGRRFLRSPS